MSLPVRRGNGRIVLAGQRGVRHPGKRADSYRPDLVMVVVEVQRIYTTANQGRRQAKEYVRWSL